MFVLIFNFNLITYVIINKIFSTEGKNIQIKENKQNQIVRITVFKPSKTPLSIKVVQCK